MNSWNIVTAYHKLCIEQFGDGYDLEVKKEKQKSVIANCPLCEDKDCTYNIDGRCHDISTIMIDSPDGMYTCSHALYGIEKDKPFYYEIRAQSYGYNNYAEMLSDGIIPTET